MLEGLASAGLAAITIDSDGRARAETPQAEAMLDGVFGIRGGRLWASDRNVQIRLDTLTSLARQNSPPGTIANVVVRRPDGRQPVLIEPMPLRGLGLDALAGARILLTLTDLDGNRTLPTNGLRELFDLSTAEAEVAVLVGLGLSPTEIARRRQVGIETVRAQLKSVFRKLGVGRQSELVRLLALINARRPGGADTNET
jgi:DNA-binding CsgD family transcriptional regulator